MTYKTLASFTLAFLILSQSFLLEAKEAAAPLTGRSVARIAQRFASMHYSQQPIGDEISQKTLKTYLNRIDPGHYYFLDSDIQEFLKYEYRLDDLLLRQGNVELSLHIFTRFKTRLSERLDYLESLEKETFDFKKDAAWKIDRSEEPYPKTMEEAQNLWRLKFKFDLLTLTLGGNTMEEAKERLLQRAKSTWKNYSQYTDNNVVALFLNALTSAFDPHSTYMEPRDQENFEINIKLSLEGIGAVLRWDDGYTVVNSIVPGGAAFREGSLKVSDRIVAVAQGDDPFESVVDVRLGDVVQLIRGKRGTRVRLQVMRKSESGDAIHTIAIVRDKIVLKDGEAKSYTLSPKSTATEDFQAPEDFKVGLIHLPSFYTDFEGRRKNLPNYKSATRDVKTILEQFIEDKVDGVVLDLRNNGGGGLDEAVDMVGLFVGKKPAVVIRNSFGGEEIRTGRQKQIYAGPLLVLLNHYSASASEILAGALQDYGRAILVGDKTTFGKGTVQNISRLPPNFGALKVTIAQFYRVEGGSTQNKGVESDIVLPSLNNVWEIGESHLENALPWKKINALNFSPDNTIKNYLPQLKSLSQKRIDNDKEFVKIKKDINEYLTNVKPRELTTILGMQKDFEKNERERKSKKEAIEKRIADAAHGQKIPDPAKKQEKGLDTGEKPSFDYGGKDHILKESLFVLEDYIRYLQQSSTAQAKLKLSRN
ncbi:MAG: carboxy terminal-processing peptidase [SAR324 cluster bacterium]|nr:carboxy terminal-processing peptidase [SAR324 cluster bacterium]